MIETLYQSLFFPGLVWLLGAAFVGGLVRGFTGFGTAMVFIPVASLFLTPVSAIAALVVMDILARRRCCGARGGLSIGPSLGGWCWVGLLAFRLARWR
tara:strand:- start:705 stop:998 length:294 start_codon:yes stop_codon:yes gene_type:complete